MSKPAFRLDWRALDLVMAAIATVQAAWTVWRGPAWTVDDAFIVARYADHLARDGRLAWNLDGPPVEGFTSLAAVGVAAAARALHGSPIAALTALGVLGLLASGPLLVALGRALDAPPGASGIVAVLHLTMAEHLTHATSGLETEAYVALGLALLWALARALRRFDASVVPVAVIGLALTMTRPEGAVAAAAALAFLVAARRSDGAALRRSLVRALAWFVVPVLAVCAWRYARFHAIAPNTWFAKQGGWNLAHARDLGRVIDDRYLDVAVVAAASLLLARRAGPAARTPRLERGEARVAVVAILALGAQTFAYARSEPIMDYARRFALHDLGWLSALALLVVAAALRALRGAPPPLARAALALLAVATASAALRGRHGLDNERLRMQYYTQSSLDLMEPLATWITENTAPGATLAVYPDAGRIPYETGRRTIDFGRLNDAYLSRHDLAPRQIADYFFELAPDVLMVSQLRPGRLYDAGADAIVADPRFAGYELVLLREGFGGVAYRLYARRAP